jgi:hypothetical protein
MTQMESATDASGCGTCSGPWRRSYLGDRASRSIQPAEVDAHVEFVATDRTEEDPGSFAARHHPALNKEGEQHGKPNERTMATILQQQWKYEIGSAG